MASLSSLMSNYTVSTHRCCSMPSSRCPTHIQSGTRDYLAIKSVNKRIQRQKTQCSHVERLHPGYATSRGRSYDNLNFNDEFHEDPFWLHFLKEAFRSLKSLFAFLAEQPSELKYIEWPSFQDTLKTATLTLALVALLIVALSSVDSALSYLFALLLRRTS